MIRSNLIPAGLLTLVTALAFTTSHADSHFSKGHHGDMMHGEHGMYHDSGHYGENWKQSLSKKQRARLDQLKLDYLKNKYPLKAKKKALKIELALLTIVDKPDMKAIDKKINEMAALKKQLMKLKYTHKVTVRKELSAEQRMHFDIAILKKAKKGKKRRSYH